MSEDIPDRPRTPETAPSHTSETLADLVAYQSGSVVSKRLLKTSGGSITLFAFDAREGLSEHTTPHEALILILEGAAEVTVAGQSVRAAAGTFVPLPASVPHAVHALEPFKMLLVMLREPASE